MNFNQKNVYLNFKKQLAISNLDKNSSKNNVSNQNQAGFSLLELIVVVLMIGILAAIVAPNWLAFVNRQQVNKANDLILAALQDAQRQAKNKKVDYSVSFQTSSNIPQIAVYQGTTPTNWRDLGAELGIPSGQILLGANLKDDQKNTAANLSNINYNFTQPVTITFDYMGNLPDADFGQEATVSKEIPGLRIVVAAPKAGDSSQASDTKRCVIIATLIGGMRTEKDSKCDLPK
jgi:prepilin-type N-terminal cleavage/methylation domain-containing protein